VSTVDTIMSRNLLTTEPGQPLQVAAHRMVDRRVGAILVLEGERLAGILTERDVLRAVGTGYDPASPVSEWMTRNPETISPDDTIDDALGLMNLGGFRHLPVTEDDRLVGIISVRDLLRAGVHEDSSPRGV
jgi:CBS domain-containing protein